MSTAAADDGQAPAPAAAAPAGDADARLRAMEDEQRRQGALLERIAAGGGAGTPAAVPEKKDAPAPASLAEQVRQEIAAADERRKAEESEETWRAGVNETLEKVRAEHAPREPEKGFRATLQRMLIGRPD